ncbi:MAG: Transcriptional regulator, partial [Humibacillus sp.]|nr:Transcriptional regulator [Humibacillus sp.]
RTATLVQACSDHRVVRVAYRSEAGSEWVLEAEPWAVVVRHSRWYLLCAVLPSRGVRTYRLDRMGDIELLDATFEPPADLDAVALLEEQLAVGWEHAVVVVVDAPLESVRRRLPRSLGRLEEVDGGSCRLVASTSNPYWYAEQLAVLRVPFRVGGCDHLRAAMADLGARFTAAGGAGASPSEPQGS